MDLEAAGTCSASKNVAVVVTHNRIDKLRDTVARLQDTPETALAAIVIVDNASTDGTATWLQNLTDPRLHPLLLEANTGGSGGFAHGMQYAIQTLSADWVIVMDDDARPSTGALEQFANHPPAADVVAAAVRYPSGDVCEMNRPSLSPFKHLDVFWKTLKTLSRDGYHIAYGAYEQPAPISVDQASFVGLFIARKCIDTIGYPDPNLFLYGDDIIYTMSLREAGFSVAFDPRIRFEHDCTTFERGAKRKFSPLWKVYYACRNGLIMYQKAAGPLLFWPILGLITLKWVLDAPRYRPHQRAYFRLLRFALLEGIKQDTRRTFDDVKRLSKDP